MWEHRSVQLVNYVDSDTYIQQLNAALGEAGQDGWEFVCAISSGENVAGRPDILIFKRRAGE